MILIAKLINSLEFVIPKVLFDSYISHDDFASVCNVLKNMAL